MGSKNNIRSIRFSDELAELIDRQQGQNFTAKLESLVHRCVWELPARESELKDLEQRIERKREQLRQMSTEAGELHMTISDLSQKAARLQTSINQAIEKWGV